MGWSAAGSTFAQSQSTKKAVEEKSEREVGGCWLLVLVEKREERESRDRLLEPFFKAR